MTADDTVTTKLAEWAALIEAATEGPWLPSARNPLVYGRRAVAVGHGEAHGAFLDADAEFIAAAREMVPALLGFVREVRKMHHPIKDSSLTSLDVDPFWRCSCGALDCPTEQAARKWIGRG